VKLFFDQNLSHRLAPSLADLFPGSIHVRDVGLKAADDEILWTYAIKHGFVIVSKDSDFHQRSFAKGYPPKVIWLRVGNCTTHMIENCLRKYYDDIQVFNEDELSSFLALG